MADEENGWTPIRRVKAPQVKVQRDGSRHVTVCLNRIPPIDWQEGFLNPPTVSTSSRMGADPTLSGDMVAFHCVEEAFDAYMANVEQRITGGNQRYEQRVLPEVERAERERKIAEDSRVVAQVKADEDAKRWDAGGGNPSGSRDW